MGMRMAPGCATPEAKQFDFRVGEWQLSWPAARQGQRDAGTNRVVKKMEACVIEEAFEGGKANPLRGMSVSTYNARTKKWQQTWVDNYGAYLDFTGEFKDGQMVLWREATNPKGEKIRQRMVWKNIRPESLDWSWESSKDGGTTWAVNWPVHYERKK
ncbi:MAG: DUF1579 family protein [Acidobacteriales bacterium]|nr:DUF1579 family protein [Terriglobales bacterium]